MIEPTDAALVAWLREGPESGPPEPLSRVLALTRTTRQRPGWLVRDRWASGRASPVGLPAFAVMLVLLLAALLAASLLVASLARQRTPFDNDPIPLTAPMSANLERLLMDGYRLGPVPAGAPEPRVSAVQATEIAGRLHLERLRNSAMPQRDTSRPDGLIRRVLFDPFKDSVHAGDPEDELALDGIAVWVVLYQWRDDNCSRDGAGFDICQTWGTYLINDKTGEFELDF